MHKGAAAPLVGGAARMMRASVLCWRAACLPAWGEPSRPGLPPEGETGKGGVNSLRRRLILHARRGRLLRCVPRFFRRSTSPASCRAVFTHV
jgi:hypothetical protein